MPLKFLFDTVTGPVAGLSKVILALGHQAEVRGHRCWNDALDEFEPNIVFYGGNKPPELQYASWVRVRELETVQEAADTFFIEQGRKCEYLASDILFLDCVDADIPHIEKAFNLGFKVLCLGDNRLDTPHYLGQCGERTKAEALASTKRLFVADKNKPYSEMQYNAFAMNLRSAYPSTLNNFGNPNAKLHEFIRKNSTYWHRFSDILIDVDQYDESARTLEVYRAEDWYSHLEGR